MYNHAPKNYVCPFCKIAKGIEDEHVITRKADIFYRDRFITAFIASHWWPNNKGKLLIIPNKHFENIYDLPESLSNKIHACAKKAAVALKEIYRCDGVSMLQHNEPAGNQEDWHYHLHVFPRYKNDRLYALYERKYLAPEKERKKFALKMRRYFE